MIKNLSKSYIHVLKLKTIYKCIYKTGMMIYAYNPSTQEVETEKVQVQGQPEQHSEF
jgi:hypothetical protein